MIYFSKARLRMAEQLRGDHVRFAAAGQQPAEGHPLLGGAQMPRGPMFVHQINVRPPAPLPLNAAANAAAAMMALPLQQPAPPRGGGGGGGVGGGAASPVWPAGPGYFHRGHSFQGTIWQLLTYLR